MKKQARKPQGFFRVCLAQINTTVGDFAANRQKVLDALSFAREEGAQLVVFPELTLCGYPPEDLLFKTHFIDENRRLLADVAAHTPGLTAVVGFAERDAKSGHLYNSAAVLSGKKIKAIYRKNKLPNYGVFDEKRYFREGTKPLIVKIAGKRVGISICEDIWDPQSFVYRRGYSGKVDVLVNISASPYHRNKQTERKRLLKMLSVSTKSWVIYINLVGGQDELVFDGGSVVMDPWGATHAEAELFKEQMVVVDIPGKSIATPAPPPRDEEEVYSALVLGTADYVRKNGFKKVLIGLSGGIDSALVAAIAVDALGAENVIGVTMPSPYTSSGTYEDSRELAANLGVRLLEFRIDSLFAEYRRVLESVFEGLPENIAEENLQARVRGNLLMALSNKFGHLVLTTGNKSEIATGYCTLYGDMAGGFAVIKDVPKTLVFALARWRNKKAGTEFIPKSIIARAPSAELRHGQKDQDSLPPYDVLDRFIDAYIGKGHPAGRIKAAGLSAAEAARVSRLIDKSEYKRRQAPPGIKITPQAFGRDRRMPITNRYREGAGR